MKGSQELQETIKQWQNEKLIKKKIESVNDGQVLLSKKETKIKKMKEHASIRIKNKREVYTRNI